MAIFGIGATYENYDVSNQFIANSIACVGWSISDAPAIHEILRCLKVGDIMYIKTSPIGQGIRVKAVGIVIDNTLEQKNNFGTGVSVKWLWNGYENIGRIDDKYNVRNNTLYEEFNKEVQTFILNLVFQNLK